MVRMGRVVVTTSGEIHVFWLERKTNANHPLDSGIYWTRQTGSVWQAEENLAPHMSYLGEPSDWDTDWEKRDFLRYCFDANTWGSGDVILVWTEPTESDDAVVQQLRYNGEWEAPTIIDTTNARGVELVTDSAGTLHLVYWLGSRQGERRGNLVHRTSDDGHSWSVGETVDASGNACCPRMVPGADDSLYLVWERKADSQTIPFWRRFANGVWGTPQGLNVRSGADSWYPTAGLLPNGNLVIAWSSRSSDRVTIEMATVAFGVALEPLVDAKAGNPGENLTYTLQVTNTGTTTDTFDVTVGGHTWPTTATTPAGPLAAGASANVTVTVHIPTNAGRGETDTATITITSRGDDSKQASVTLVTTTKHAMFLPLIVKSPTGQGMVDVRHLPHVITTPEAAGESIERDE